MSRGRKIWDVLMPVAVFFLCNLAASAVITSAVMAFSGERDFAGVIQSVRSLSLVASLVNFALVIIVQSYFRKRDTYRFGKEQRVWPAWKIVIGILVVCAAGAAGNYLIIHSGLEEIFPFYQQIQELTFENQNPILLILTTVVLGPAAEEMTFRGLAQRRAGVWMKPGTAIVITALLFGLAHMNMIQLIYAFGLGLLLGILYDRSQSLAASIFAHMAVNALTLWLF